MNNNDRCCINLYKIHHNIKTNLQSGRRGITQGGGDG